MVIMRQVQSLTRDIFRDEDGFTTVGMALSLLLCLCLIFSAGRAYRIESRSSEIQYVADAAALAAENEIAEYMVVVRLCDAVVLSLSLTSLLSSGLGVVAACTPVSAPLSEPLLTLGKNIADARDRFSHAAQSGLEKLQRALPFIACANAILVAQANNKDGSNYIAFALLAPFEGTPVQVGVGDETKEAQAEIDGRVDDLQEASLAAEEQTREAREAKERAFKRDCGDNPAYCMSERAATLAGMSGVENPIFASLDTWSFQVPLKRAQAYYAQRLQQEAPATDAVDEQVRSALRKQFYAYAVEQLEQGYVHEQLDAFDAYFPRLPKNTDEMRQTTLYTDACYPVTESEGVYILHAWVGCPQAGDFLRLGSLQEAESQAFDTCSSCEFSASSLGKVAAASSSIENGFEYHYDAVAQAAEDYQKARSEAVPHVQEAKQIADSLLDALKEALGTAAKSRIDARPPGYAGVIVLVANVSNADTSQGFVSSFIESSGAVGTRLALSGATLISEPAGEAGSEISSLLDGYSGENAAIGAAKVVLAAWSGVIHAYGQGQQALSDALRQSLNKLPLMSESGLGTWAADALTDTIESLGLAPANIDALKPVVVNTGHVAKGDPNSFFANLTEVKSEIARNPELADNPISGVITRVEDQASEALDQLDSLEIARVEIFDGAVSFPIEISLPQPIKDLANEGIAWIGDTLRSLESAVVRVRVWE